MQHCSLNSAGADKIGEMLHHNNSIVSIDLSENDIEDTGVEGLMYHLINNTALQHIDLRDNKITTVGANYLKRLIATDHPTLTSIELSGNYGLKDEGVHVILSSLTVTMKFGLRWVGATMLSCPIIAAALHKVKSNFMDSELVYNAIAETTTVNNLEICINHWGLRSAYKNDVLIAISHNKSIERFKLTFGYFCFYKWIPGVACILKNTKTLKELVIESDMGSCEDVLPLAESLMINSSLKTLTIHKNRVKFTTLMFLLKTIHNDVLEKLELGSFDPEKYGYKETLKSVETFVKGINEAARRAAGVSCTLNVVL
ncbi:leucine-rich repeat-containing protein 74B-like [Dysidea avara]|uniref:leucine-rich repeat-containing protein 74B-like n=1 Tax=Dysidea avara TaxID=196820 RepID=UPI003326605E